MTRKPLRLSLKYTSIASVRTEARRLCCKLVHFHLLGTAHTPQVPPPYRPRRKRCPTSSRTATSRSSTGQSVGSLDQQLWHCIHACVRASTHQPSSTNTRTPSLSLSPSHTNHRRAQQEHRRQLEALQQELTSRSEAFDLYRARSHTTLKKVAAAQQRADARLAGAQVRRLVGGSGVGVGVDG